jgi:hypothetical protein
MKTAGNENPNSRTRLRVEPSPWSGSSEPSTLIQSGWKAGKDPAAGVVFFLTFSFIERIRHLGRSIGHHEPDGPRKTRDAILTSGKFL